MNQLKFGILASGVIGLAACFLPLATGGGVSVSFWSMHPVLGVQAYLVLAGYSAGLLMGAIAVAKPPMQRWQSTCALAAFLFVVVKLRDQLLDLFVHGAVGAKLMVVAAFAGLVFSGLCLAKPEQAK